MRMLSPAYVVATVVIAVTGSAFAQSVARPAGTTASTSQPPVRTTGAPAVATNRTSGGANPVTTLPNNNGNITSTTVTNADGSTTTTFSNGLTSNSNGISSSRSGSNMASSASNTPIGSTSANGTTTNSSTSATGSSSTNGSNVNGSNVNGSNVNGVVGTGNQILTPGVAGTVLAPGVVTPAIINGNLGSITSDGERVFDAAGNPIDLGSNNVQLVNNGSAGSIVTQETVRTGNTAGLDRAIKQAERDRKRIGRNGQLLQSIAPRTNVDRTDQMPDDGPTPALTGSASTLLQR